MSEETNGNAGSENENDEQTGAVGIDWTGELVEKTFTLKVPAGFDNLLRHETAFGYRGEKGKYKDAEGKEHKIINRALVQFSDIKALIDNALRNVNVKLQRLDNWPKDGVPLVDELGRFIQPEKTLDELINELPPEELVKQIGPENMKRLAAIFAANAALYEDKTITDGAPDNPTNGMSDQQLETAAKKGAASAKRATNRK